MGRIGDYTKGKIYSIRSHQTDMIYIGSTTKSLSQRLATHKANYKAYLNGKYNNVTSYKIISLGDAYIELIENFSCSCKDELTKREGHFIRTLENVINKNIMGQTKKEYRENNKEKIKEQKSKLITCECSVVYTHDHASRHKRSKFHQNYINNKNKILVDNIIKCPEIQENQQEKQVADV